MKIPQDLYIDLCSTVMPHMPLDGQNSMRKRWDAMWASGFDIMRLYNAGLNDAHIDTALKRIATFKDHKS
jgi:hypothetical protein